MIEKTYEVIDKIDEYMKELGFYKLKTKIISSKASKKLIDRFNNSKEIYSKYGTKDDFLVCKKELFDNKDINKYLSIQNDVNLLTLYINKKINEITGDTTHHG